MNPWIRYQVCHHKPINQSAKKLNVQSSVSHKLGDSSGGQYPPFRGISRKQTGSEQVDPVFLEKSGVHQKRKNTFTNQQNGQGKRHTMQETTHDKPKSTIIDSTPKESAKPEVGDTERVHQPTLSRISDHEIPANVLDFLGGCVSYSGCG